MVDLGERGELVAFLRLVMSESNANARMAQAEMYPLSAKFFAAVKQLQRKYTAPELARLL